MTFEEYQNFCESTAFYPGQRSINGLSYAVIGLSGEVGEVCNKFKKILRDDKGIVTPARSHEIFLELGDVLWYISQTATELGLSLSDIVLANIVKIEKRKDSGTLQGSGDHR